MTRQTAQPASRRVLAAPGRDRVKRLLEDDRAAYLVPSQQVRSKRVRKAEWGDPEDLNPMRREQRKIRGFRVPDPLDGLIDVRREHIEAANKLRRAWELSDGARPGHERLVRVGGGFESGSGPSYIQCKAIQEVERMKNAIGPRNWIALRLVVLQGLDATALGERMGMSRHRAAGYLVAALDRLAELYAPRTKARHTIREDT